MIMNGNTPTLISGVPKVAVSLATIRSQASAMPERARQHVPVRRADGGLAELHDQREEPREALGAEVLVHERHVGGELLEVAAGAEDLLVRRAEHDAAHALVVARRLEGVDQLAEQLVRERVARVGRVRARSWPRRRRAPRRGASRRPSRGSSTSSGSGGAHAARMSTRSPRKGTPSASSSRRCARPWRASRPRGPRAATGPSGRRTPRAPRRRSAARLATGRRRS